MRISRASRGNSEPQEAITGSETGESKRESGKWAAEKAAEKNKSGDPAAEKLPAAPEIETERKRLPEAKQQERDRIRMEKVERLREEKTKQPNAPWPLRVGQAFNPPIQACVNDIRLLQSGGRIGLAPIFSFTFEEDRQAVKAPLQAFAAGVDRLQNKLSHLSSIQLMQRNSNNNRTVSSIVSRKIA